MERKAFLRNAVGLFGIVSLLDACKKTDTNASASTTTTANTQTSGCYESPTETEGPYPYPGGEVNNPMNRSNITETKTGVGLTLALKVVNANNSCAVVPGARVDIWHCDKDGYYSGYAGQQGVSTVGQTYLRGWQNAGSDGVANFTTIYPGWYSGRATHIHFEVYIGGVLKKTGQFTFNEATSDSVHATYGLGANPTRNASDGILGNSSTDLAKEIVSLTGSVSAGFAGTFMIGLSL